MEPIKDPITSFGYQVVNAEIVDDSKPAASKFDFNTYQQKQVSKEIETTDNGLNLTRVFGNSALWVGVQEASVQVLFNAGYLGIFPSAVSALFPATSIIFGLTCLSSRPFTIERKQEFAAHATRVVLGTGLLAKHASDKGKISDIAGRGIKSFQGEIDRYEGVKPTPADNSFMTGALFGVVIAIALYLISKKLGGTKND